MNQQKLYGIMDRRFSLGELHTLAFDCGWNRESIGTNHTVKSTFLMELIGYAMRHSAINRLMQAAANRSPVLMFDGETLREVNGDTYQHTDEPAAPEIDPRVAQKAAIIKQLKAKQPQAIYDALVFMLENTAV